ncbi:unnamed protein product, partial [Nesidiocoris tenuis]
DTQGGSCVGRGALVAEGDHYWGSRCSGRGAGTGNPCKPIVPLPPSSHSQDSPVSTCAAWTRWRIDFDTAARPISGKYQPARAPHPSVDKQPFYHAVIQPFPRSVCLIGYNN